MRQIAPKPDVAVKEAFGDAVAAAAGPTAGRFLAVAVSAPDGRLNSETAPIGAVSETFTPTAEATRRGDRDGVLGNGGRLPPSSRTFTVADAHALPPAAAVTAEAAARGRAGHQWPKAAPSTARFPSTPRRRRKSLSVALALAPGDPVQASTYRLSLNRG